MSLGLIYRCGRRAKDKALQRVHLSLYGGFESSVRLRRERQLMLERCSPRSVCLVISQPRGSTHSHEAFFAKRFLGSGNPRWLRKVVPA